MPKEFRQNRFEGLRESASVGADAGPSPRLRIAGVPPKDSTAPSPRLRRRRGAAARPSGIPGARGEAEGSGLCWL